MADKSFIETVKAKLLELEQTNEGVRLYKSLQAVLNNLSNGTETHTNGFDFQKKPLKEGDDSKSNKKIVAEIIKEAGRFLHVREILDLAKLKYGNINEKSIRQSVYYLKANGSIVSFAVNGSNQNTFWGSPKWLNADGKIKPEHKFDEKQIIHSTKEVIDI